ncbi:flavodoxin-dependent (E)-4-hydroxy-3-methylbut-2-enyl-diphosphate synthase [Candidatus Woesearchaeota archaeon]|nr:flavodoxin-dependent (E)-4-hydroxy-3-methylbut-2-enyl-diphosphate synthase [Candidatus Woesearchaeota archaeon]MBU3942007.1 flavodoxin-dependent (E)-4-hydroxy-3-methylbut-2-enyl-diphosphate synthase [Nanoarchaeota archaeon]
MERRKTKGVKVGKLKIGNNAPITVQSMCTTHTRDVNATLKQVHELEDAGCEIVRVSVEDMNEAKSLKKIKENISIPLVADIHFDYRLAIESAKYADKLRINPGNIGSNDKVKLVVKQAKDYNIPIRIGVNLGSLEKEIIEKFGLTSKAMVESALKHIKILEELDFYNTIISMKSSDIKRTVDAYRMMATKVGYPFHIGITEAGTAYTGTIKSSIGIGSLLLDGIGDTIRVSLTTNPVDEVRAGIEILNSLNIRKGRTIISCPGCGRTEIDLIGLTKSVEQATANIKKPIKIAVMGCAVNGLGEAKEADVGVAGAKNFGIIFRKGNVVNKVKKDKILKALLGEIDKL